MSTLTDTERLNLLERWAIRGEDEAEAIKDWYWHRAQEGVTLRQVVDEIAERLGLTPVYGAITFDQPEHADWVDVYGTPTCVHLPPGTYTARAVHLASGETVPLTLHVAAAPPDAPLIQLPMGQLPKT